MRDSVSKRVSGKGGRGREREGERGQTCDYHRRRRGIHWDRQVTSSTVAWPSGDPELVLFGGQLSFHVWVFLSGTRREGGEVEEEEEERWGEMGL